MFLEFFSCFLFDSRKKFLVRGVGRESDHISPFYKFIKGNEKTVKSTQFLTLKIDMLSYTG